jgi:hypothetical protein
MKINKIDIFSDQVKGKVSKDVKDHGDHPYFVKKADKAVETLKVVGFPKGIRPASSTK